MTCDHCNASWHLIFGLGLFKWAELELESSNGKGRELLSKRLEGEEWRKICLETKRKTKSAGIERSDSKIIVREIIKEVVLIPCQYCGGLMPQQSITCPHCSALRK